MVEEELPRKREPIGHHGNLFHGGTTIQVAIQIIWTIPQGSMGAVSNQDIGITRDRSIPRL